MEMSRGAIVVGVLATIAVATAAAWWTSPTRGARQTPQPDPTSKTAKDDRTPPALYKWQDANGVWNYTDKPPPGRAFEIIRDTPNVTPMDTVVPSSPAPPSDIPPPPAE